MAKQNALVAKAEQALRTAHANLGQGDADAAANRAYYAAFYVATAALLSVGETPKSHNGVHRRFYMHFVKDGPLSGEVGGIFSYA